MPVGLQQQPRAARQSSTARAANIGRTPTGVMGLPRAGKPWFGSVGQQLDCSQARKPTRIARNVSGFKSRATGSDSQGGASANPLLVALERAQVLLAEKTQVREALEAEAQEVAQVGRRAAS